MPLASLSRLALSPLPRLSLASLCPLISLLPPTSQAAVYKEAIRRIAEQHKEGGEKRMTSDFITSSFTLLRKAALHPM